MPLKKVKKFTEKSDKKTEEQQLIQATINSQYSLLIPKINAEYVAVRNPLDTTSKNFSTKSNDLVEFLKKLSSLGFAEKLIKDFEELKKIDSKWEDVINNLQSQGAFNNE
jgi:hypothetical protein